MRHAFDLTHFQWAVYKAGYRWARYNEIANPELNVEEAEYSGPFLVIPSVVREVPPGRPWRHSKKHIPYATSDARYYSPIPGTFMTFAQLEPNTESVLAFASRYGHLGVERFLGDITQDGRESKVIGEPFLAWRQEIEVMKHALDAWDMSRKNLVGKLRRHVHRERGNVEYDPLTDVPEKGRPIWSLPTRIPTPNRVSPDLGEVLGGFSDGKIARLYMQSQIDMRLSKHCALAMIADADYSGLRLHAVPRNLLGALWLQFAFAVSGSSNLRKCKMCPTWFEVSSGARRPHSIYCSDACKVRGYRELIARARGLKTQGKSVPAIAAELHRTPTRIKKWVGSSS